MARTRKDASWNVKSAREGTIKHDHRAGKCVVGTWKERTQREKAYLKHRKNECPRTPSMVECIHDHQRDILQAEIDHKRARYKNSVAPIKGWGAKEVGAAAQKMLEAGRIPNCMESKTHQVDLLDIDLHLREDEVLFNLKDVARFIRYYTVSFLIFPRSGDIACSACDSYEAITCVPTLDYRGSYYESWEVKDNKRARTRDSLRKQVVTYNSRSVAGD